MNSKPSVYIVDDHQLLAEGLAELIVKSGMQMCGTASDGITAVQQVVILKPDLILMDLDLPGLNGLEACRQILEVWPEAKVIIISMHLEKSLVEKCMKTGARGYLPKNADAGEFIKALKTILKGDTYFTANLSYTPDYQKLKSPVDAVSSNIHKASELSKREREILRLIADGFNSREIADKLHLSHYTVETHRKNMMRKLDVNNSAELIRFAVKAGIID